MQIDLTQVKCPETFLYVKMALEKAQGSQMLEFLFDKIETAKRVSLAIEEEGHVVKSCEVLEDKEKVKMLVKKVR